MKTEKIEFFNQIYSRKIAPFVHVFGNMPISGILFTCENGQEHGLKIEHEKFWTRTRTGTWAGTWPLTGAGQGHGQGHGHGHGHRQ
jgi:hypothetical protein